MVSAMARVCLVGLALLIVSRPAQAADATVGVMTITGSMTLTATDGAAASKDAAFTAGVKTTIATVASVLVSEVSATFTAVGTTVTVAYTVTVAGGGAAATTTQATTLKALEEVTKAALQTKVESDLKSATSTMEASVTAWATPVSKVAKVAAATTTKAGGKTTTAASGTTKAGGKTTTAASGTKTTKAASGTTKAASGGVMTITGSMSLTVKDGAAASKDAAFKTGVTKTIATVADVLVSTVSATFTAAGTTVTVAYTVTVAGGGATATTNQAKVLKSLKGVTKPQLQTQVAADLKASGSTIVSTVTAWAVPASKVAAAVPAAVASDATHWLPSVVTTALAVLVLNM